MFLSILLPCLQNQGIFYKKKCTFAITIVITNCFILYHCFEIVHYIKDVFSVILLFYEIGITFFFPPPELVLMSC